MTKEPGTTRDHVVPVMYLRRWGVESNGGAQVIAATADDPHRAFRTSVRKVGSEKGFYWGESSDGLPRHQMEELLSSIEDVATPAFRVLLDKGRTVYGRRLPTLAATR